MSPFLRTLRGQATLFALTTLGAALLAAGLATQTSFFERYVVQKYGEPTVAAAEYAASVVAGTAPLTGDEAESTYAVWMTASASPSLSNLSDADAATLRSLVLRTLVSGSPDQRVRALALWRTARPADDLFDEAMAYARRLGRDDVVQALESHR